MLTLDSGLTMRALSPNNVVTEFYKCIPLIEKFLKRSEGESDLMSISKSVYEGYFQCWMIEEEGELVGVCITKVDRWVSYSALHIIGLGAKPGYWKIFRDAHKYLERLAREWDCDRLSVWTNRGWVRLFDNKGFTGEHGEVYKKKYEILHMKLNK